LAETLVAIALASPACCWWFSVAKNKLVKVFIAFLEGKSTSLITTDPIHRALVEYGAVYFDSMASL